jgi:hypothetical protein
MKKPPLLIIVVLFILATCQKTQVAIKIPSPTQTITDVPVKMVSPTITLRPTSTPFLTPEVATYQIPRWLKQPNNHVLMLVDSKTDYSTWPNNYRVISFFNADSGERFDVELAYFNFAFWLDSTHIGFIHGDLCSYFTYGSVLDLTTGNLVRYKSHEIPYENFCPKNRSSKFSVWVGTREEETPIYVHNNKNGERKKIIPPNISIKNLNAVLSPDASTIVALQDINDDYRGDQFVIYDSLSHGIKGKSIVANASLYYYFIRNSGQVVYLTGSKPCILNLDTLMKDCGIPIPSQYSPHLEGVTQKGDEIIFQYNTIPRSGYYNGQLCIYGVFTGRNNCPTEGLDILAVTPFTITTVNGVETRNSGKFVADYIFSPDERFIAFVYSYGCPSCDYFNDVGRAIVSIDGKTYYDLGEHFKSSILAEWRPAP